MKVGDVVQLNSGGPAMTVTGVGTDRVRCRWFDENKAIHTDTFVIGALRPLDDGKTSGGVKGTQDADYDPFK